MSPTGSPGAGASPTGREHPFVRVVVLNYQGGEHVLRAVEALTGLDWPADRLDLVVVDNASTDGSPDAIRERFEQVRVLGLDRNMGFPANNAALADLDGVDHVGLVNNDAFVSAGWLQPLVAALEADPSLGAACPKVLFDGHFVEVPLDGPTWVSAARVGGRDRWDRCRFDDGDWSHGTTPATRGWRRLDGHGSLRVPVDGSEAVPDTVAIEVRAGEHATPTWIDAAVVGTAFEVVNNAGSVLLDGGWGADRGYGRRDDGTYDRPEEVFAWCGNGVVLRRDHLLDVGLLHEQYFMYYEDLDLSWRGRARGWRYRYEPTSVVHHLHATSSVEGSDLFAFYNARNRLLLLARNAPAGMALRAGARHVATTGRQAIRGAVARLRRRDAPDLRRARIGARAGVSLLGALPSVVRDRRRLRAEATVPDAEVLAWMRPRP